VLVDNIEVRQPSLDDVFFSLTGGHIESDDGDEVDAEDEVGVHGAAEAAEDELEGASA
jgi:hypothetical protein